MFRPFPKCCRQLVIRPFCLTLLVLVSSTGLLHAAELETLELGFQGMGKVGRWVAVNATASGLTEGDPVQLRATFSDPRGDTCVEIVDRATVDSAGKAAFSGYFKPGRLDGFGQIQVVNEQTEAVMCRQVISHGASVETATESTAVTNTLKLHPLDVPFLLTIGEPAGIPELLRNASNYRDDRELLQGVSVSEASDLPDSLLGLDVIDLLLIADDFEVTAQQVQAIQKWVLNGGRLFVSSGKSVESLLSSKLGGWLKDRFGIGPEPIRVFDLSVMQSFVRGATVLQTNREAVSMAVLRNDQTYDNIVSLEGTVAGTQSVGAGTVTLVAVDLNQRPLSRWRSLPDFYEKLFFGKKFSEQSRRESRSSRISQSGVSDLATQMMATVDAVPTSGRWSTWAVMGLIVGYLMLIGPVDYLLVTRILKRPHLTWLTFPLMLVAGAVALFAGAGSQGTAQLKQLHLIDVAPHAAGSHIQSQSWMSLSAPETMRADLQAVTSLFGAADSQGDAAQPLLTWSGRPEDIYGGMYRVGGIGLGRQAYIHDSAQPERLSGVPLLINGSRDLYANWQTTTAAPVISSQLSVSGYGLLNGSFSHSLPVAINDWVIMYGNRVYRSRRSSADSRLKAGRQWDSRSTDIYASDLKSFLNASRLVQSERIDAGNRGMTQVITPYDRQSQDPFYILTAATFYELAGASDYIGLSNSLLSRLQLSDTIRLNHAVLIGLTDTAATQLQLNGSDQPAATTNTIVRLLIPVDRRPAQELAPPKDPKDKG